MCTWEEDITWNTGYVFEGQKKSGTYHDIPDTGGKAGESGPETYLILQSSLLL